MDFIFDRSLVLYLPLYKLDGVSFISKDAYGHLCPVTGALWRPDGRYFDGIDDQIDCGSTDKSRFNWLHGAADTAGFQWTIEFWSKLTSLASIQRIMGTQSGTSAKVGVFLYIATDGSIYFIIGRGVAGQSVITYPGVVGQYPNDGSFHHIVLTYNQALVSGNLQVYCDGRNVGSGDKTGNTPSTADSTGYMRIGRDGEGAAASMLGTIGEFRIYRRAFNPLEVQHNCLATEWRYR